MRLANLIVSWFVWSNWASMWFNGIEVGNEQEEGRETRRFRSF